MDINKPMNTLSVLADVQRFLQENMANFGVELFPEQPQEYRMNHANGVVLIAYDSSDYGQPKHSLHMHQSRTIKLRLSVICSSQHNDLGALQALDQIRYHLLGYKPQHCQQIRFESERFDGEESGLWQYGLTVSCVTQAVEKCRKTDEAPKFKSGVYTTPIKTN